MTAVYILIYLSGCATVYFILRHISRSGSCPMISKWTVDQRFMTLILSLFSWWVFVTLAVAIPLVLLLIQVGKVIGKIFGKTDWNAPAKW